MNMNCFRGRRAWVLLLATCTGTFSLLNRAMAASGDIYSLGAPTGGTSLGGAINESAQVAGDATLSTGAVHAFLFTGSPGNGGAIHDLGTLGGTNSYGVGINSAGAVVGSSDLANGQSRAFLYTGTPGANGLMHDL